MTSIAIGVANYGNIRVECSSSLIYSFQQDSKERNLLNTLIQSQSPYIDDNRNTIINLFLNSRCEWLLFIDTDIEINFYDIYKLYDIATKYNLYILGGIYFWGLEHYSTKIRPMIKKVVDENNHYEEIMMDYPVDKEYFEVSSTGTGCLLIHRSVFEKISNLGPDNNNYWFKTYDDNVGFIGEDVYFCKLAKENGFKIYVTPKIMLNHYKTVIFNYDLFKEQNSINN